MSALLPICIYFNFEHARAIVSFSRSALCEYFRYTCGHNSACECVAIAHAFDPQNFPLANVDDGDSDSNRNPSLRTLSRPLIRCSATTESYHNMLLVGRSTFALFGFTLACCYNAVPFYKLCAFFRAVRRQLDAEQKCGSIKHLQCVVPNTQSASRR